MVCIDLGCLCSDNLCGLLLFTDFFTGALILVEYERSKRKYQVGIERPTNSWMEVIVASLYMINKELYLLKKNLNFIMNIKSNSSNY